MTPKQKALELFFKYEIENRHFFKNGFEYNGKKTKNCCLIAINEIINILKETVYFKQETYNYWIEVKKELNNI